MAEANQASVATIFVNGMPIDPDTIASEAQHHPMPPDKPGWAWRAAAHALVSRELLLQQARERGLQAEPRELSTGIHETEDEALVRQLLELVIEPATVNDAELRHIYDAHPEWFRGPSLFEAAHILFSARPDDTPAYEKARMSAYLVMDELHAQPQRFAVLAAEHSACPSRDSGGLLGQLASGDTVPEFEAALATMEEGALSHEPVATRYGYHIIRLDARIKGETLPFESVRPRLREAQEKAEWVKAGRRYMDGLIAQSQIDGIDMHSAPWLTHQVHQRQSAIEPSDPSRPTMNVELVSRQPPRPLHEQVARRRPTVRPR